jgi:hypothetical protein
MAHRGNRPPPEVTAERERKAFRLRCRGKTTQAIADRLGMTRQGIEALLKRVETRELKRLTGSWERLKVTDHHRYEHAVQESFDAWHRSKKPIGKAGRRTVKAAGGLGDDDQLGGDQIVETADKIEQTGNVAYLHTAFKAMSEQADLWGLKVLPASNDTASSISQLAEDAAKRAKVYEARKEREATPRDSAGTPGNDPSGDDGVS